MTMKKIIITIAFMIAAAVASADNYVKERMLPTQVLSYTQVTAGSTKFYEIKVKRLNGDIVTTFISSDDYKKLHKREYAWSLCYDKKDKRFFVVTDLERMVLNK